MSNPYQPPVAKVDEPPVFGNNSGGGRSVIPPPGVKGWSWGAFWLNWIWGIGNKTWIALLAFLPYIGIIFCFYLGFKGRELAWRNKRWESLEHFNRIQRRWSVWGWVLLLIVGILAILAIPAYEQSLSRVPVR